MEAELFHAHGHRERQTDMIMLMSRFAVLPTRLKQPIQKLFLSMNLDFIKYLQLSGETFPGVLCVWQIMRKSFCDCATYL